jgi:hypothetical protein
MSIFAPKWSNFGQKEPKKWILRIFPRKKIAPFFKRPKNMFLWRKWGTFIAAFGRNRPKWAYLAQNGQKTPKKSILRIFPRNFFAPFFKRPKNMFLWRKWGTFIVAFGRNGPKWAYLAQNGQILVKKSPKSEF